MLGICYGMQLMTDALGGEVAPRAAARVRPRAYDPDRATGAPLFADVPAELRVWASHGDFVAAAPPGFDGDGDAAPNAPIAAMQTPDRSSTRCCSTRRSRTPTTALDILRNFAVRRLRLHRRLDDGVVHRRERSRGSARRSDDGRVVCGLSGGVDSTVAALLIHRAIGDRLTCIFVDNGLLRLDEAEQVRRAVRASCSCRSTSSTRPACSSSGSPA